MSFNTKMVPSDDFIVEELFELFKSFEVKFSKEALVAFLLEQWSHLLKSRYDMLLDIDDKLCEINWHDSDKEMTARKATVKRIELFLDESKIPPEALSSILKFGMLGITRLGEDLNRFQSFELKMAAASYNMMMEHSNNEKPSEEEEEILTPDEVLNQIHDS